MADRYPIYAIGSRFFVLGFRGIGCHPIICEEPDRIFKNLEKGIYIVEPGLAAKVYDKIENINTTNSDITIIVYGTDSLNRHIERATGMMTKREGSHG